jgi:hypothetical protein
VNIESLSALIDLEVKPNVAIESNLGIDEYGPY